MKFVGAAPGPGKIAAHLIDGTQRDAAVEFGILEPFRHGGATELLKAVDKLLSDRLGRLGHARHQEASRLCHPRVVMLGDESERYLPRRMIRRI